MEPEKKPIEEGKRSFHEKFVVAFAAMVMIAIFLKILFF
jgi:hypothetical protein